MGGMSEAQFGEDFGDRQAAKTPVEECGQKLQILTNGERALQPIGVTDIVDLLGDRFLRGRRKRDSTRTWQESCECAQKGGFSRPVRTCHREALAVAESKGQLRDQGAAAALDSQI
jgi:hypothetical protein